MAICRCCSSIDKLGTAYGLMTALQNLGLAVAPLLAAYVIKKGSYTAGAMR